MSSPVVSDSTKKRKLNDGSESPVAAAAASQPASTSPSSTTSSPATPATPVKPKHPALIEHELDQLRPEGEIVVGRNGDRYKITTMQGSKRRIPVDRPVRIYADGIYDLFHYGHARSLQQSKNLFPNTYLLCGVCNDAITHKLKGRTVMDESQRYESVAHCRYVDEVVPSAPWVATLDFCEKMNIDFMSHGQDITVDENGVDTYDEVKKAGRFLFIERTEGISTSDIIMKLLREYDEYVWRNLSRGYKRQDMNVSFLNEQRIKLEHEMEKLRSTIKTKSDEFAHKKDEMLHDFVGSFQKVFSKKRKREDGEEADGVLLTPAEDGASSAQDSNL